MHEDFPDSMLKRKNFAEFLFYYIFFFYCNTVFDFIAKILEFSSSYFIITRTPTSVQT